MKQFQIRHLPIFDDYEFRGVISAYDIINSAVFKRTEIFDEVEDIIIIKR